VTVFLVMNVKSKKIKVACMFNLALCCKV